MVEANLVGEHEINAGRSLLRELEKQGIVVTAAFWYYDAEFDRWRLILAMPICDSKGPIAAYTAIRGALSRIDQSKRLDMVRITAENTKETVVLALSKLISIAPGSGTTRVTRSSVNGVYVEDAIIYHTQAPTEPRRASKRLAGTSGKKSSKH